MKIQLRSDPTPDERLPGYMLRMSSANGLSSPRLLFRHTLNSNVGHMAYPVDTTGLGRMLDVGSDVIERLAYGISGQGGNLTFNGHQIGRGTVYTLKPKVCPACLQERLVVPAVWDFSHWLVCPIHSVWLVNRCQACDKSISWCRPGVDLCRCGGSLSRADHHRADSNQVALAELLAGLLSPASQSSSAYLHGLVGSIKPMHFISFMRSVRFAIGAARQVRLPKSSKDAAREEFSATARLLSDWPAQLWRIFDCHLDRVPDRPIASEIYKTFKRMNGFGSHERPLFVTEAIQGYVRNRIERLPATDQRRVTSRARPSEHSVLLRPAARILRMSEERVAGLVATEVIPGEIFEGNGRRHVRVNARWLARYGRGEIALPSYKQAGRFEFMRTLGISRPGDLTQLRNAGHVEPVQGPIQMLRDGAYVEPLLEFLRRTLHTQSQLQPIDNASLRSLAATLTTLKAGRASILLICPHGRGLQRYGVLGQDGIPYLLARDASAPDWMGFSEAADLLRTRLKTVKRLAATSPLVRRVGEVGLRKSFLWRSEVKAFKADYILLSSIARAFGVPPKTALRVLSKNGVAPANVGASAAFYYARGQIERFAKPLGINLEPPITERQHRSG